MDLFSTVMGTIKREFPSPHISDDVPEIQMELSAEQGRQDPARWKQQRHFLRERGIAPRTMQEAGV